MPFSKSNEILRQIIIDHYNNPVNRGLLNEPASIKKRYQSEECIDDITIETLIKKNRICHSHFTGNACAICTASTDILISLTNGKSIEEANKIIDNYLAMIRNEKKYDVDLLQEAIAFKNIYLQPNRIQCATIGANLLKYLINVICK